VQVVPLLAYELRGKLWLYGSTGGGWHFITLPKRQAAEIRQIMSDARRGWGSLRVKATIGGTTWATSIFPEKRSGSYLLPVKADVRRAEGVAEGDTVRFRIELEG
jgi:hypothetical protein